MAVCDICNKIMPGANPSLTIRVGHPVAKDWQIASHYLIAQSPGLIKHAVMVHMKPLGVKSEQITNEVMTIWLKTKEESYGHGDWLLCPECSVFLTPSKKVQKSESNIGEITPSGKTNHEKSITHPEKFEGSLTHQSQRALYLTEIVLQCIVHGIKSIISDKGYMLSITPDTAQWAMPYSKRIASAREHFSKGNLKAALAEYQTLLRELPDAAIVLNDLGVCHAEMGHNELAYTYIKKALVYAPEEKRDEIMPNLIKLEREINNILEKSHKIAKNKLNIDAEHDISKELNLKRKWWRFWK